MILRVCSVSGLDRIPHAPVQTNKHASVQRNIATNSGKDSFERTQNVSFGYYDDCWLKDDSFINKSHPHADYGDIFHPNTDFSKINCACFVKAKKDFSNMKNCNFTNTNFEESVFFSSDFTGSDFTGANFSRSNLSLSSMRNIKTKKTDFSYCLLMGCDFKDAELGIRTDMSFANLCGADLSKTSLEKCFMLNTLYNEETKFPDGFDPEKKEMFLLESYRDYSGENFERLQMPWLTFKNNDFSKANFKRANLKGITFENCNFKNSEMTRAYASKAILKNVDFSGSKLKQFNLKKSSLENVDFSNSNLRGAILTWKEAKDINLEGAVYDQYTVFNPDFDPKKHGMIEVISPIEYYIREREDY